MEFLAELLIALVQFICEVLLQMAGDALAELGWNALREVFRPSHPPLRGSGPGWLLDHRRCARRSESFGLSETFRCEYASSARDSGACAHSFGPCRCSSTSALAPLG